MSPKPKKVRKEWTITFRHHFKVEALANTVTIPDLEKRLMEDALKRGYVLLEPYWYQQFLRDVGMVDQVSAPAAYAGKKRAIEIINKHRDSLHKDKRNKIYF